MVRSRVRARRRVITVIVVLLGAAAWGRHVGSASAGVIPARVVRTFDGDTVEVLVGRGDAARPETVRMLGVDTPETHHPRKPVQCFGPEAAAFTAARLPPGTAVRLELDVEQRDRYGRLLAHVLVDDARFGDELLRAGYARLLVIAPNGAHAREMLRAELEARSAGRGLWGVCGGR
ncbi:MAG: thermonuclease family protein [Actinomycetota bacterium]